MTAEVEGQGDDDDSGEMFLVEPDELLYPRHMGASYRPSARRSPEAPPIVSSIFVISDAVRRRRRPSSWSRTQSYEVGSIRRRVIGWNQCNSCLRNARGRLTTRGFGEPGSSPVSRRSKAAQGPEGGDVVGRGVDVCAGRSSPAGCR